MKKKLWFFVGALIILIIFSGVVYSDDIKVKEEKIMDKKIKVEYVPDEILLKFKTGILPEEEEAIFQEFELSKKSKIKKLKVHRLKIPQKTTVPKIIKKLKKNLLIEFAEPNYYAYASMVPNDPFYSYQWHFDNVAYGGIHMESAWDVTTGDSSVIVAVVDTGVAYEDYPGPGFWHLDTYNAYAGNYSWWCGVSQALSSWTAIYGANPTPPGYGDGWKQYLQHSFNLTSATGTVTFSYYYKYDIERGYDYFYVDVSDNNGQSWTKLKEYTNSQGPPGGKEVDWTQESIDLTSYTGNNILLRFRFNSDETFSDEDGNFNSDGAVYIDEVELEDNSGILFYDDMESGIGSWETTRYEQAPDLAGTSFIAGYDFVNNDSHPNDDGAHGTHVTGTIAQTTNNNLGVAGIAFSTSIMPVKVLNAGGTGSYDMVINGIIHAADNGADIISMSLGGSGSSSALESAVNYAYDNGVAVIAACGNANANSCDYPATYTNVIAVGATRYDEQRAYYSSYGSSLDLVAPGGDLNVDQNSDGYDDGVLQQTFGDTPIDFSYWFYQGTSMATPHVSGVAALLLALNSSLTPNEIRNILQSTAEDLGTAGWDQYYGGGLINASAAVEAVLPSGEFISITFEGPIDFGNLDPSTSNNTAENPYNIIINPETTVNVDIYQYGENYTLESNTITIDNMKWNEINSPGNSITSTYSLIMENKDDGDYPIYYWLDIPLAQYAGNYETTIYIKAVETGTLL